MIPINPENKIVDTDNNGSPMLMGAFFWYIQKYNKLPTALKTPARQAILTPLDVKFISCPAILKKNIMTIVTAADDKDSATDPTNACKLLLLMLSSKL